MKTFITICGLLALPFVAAGQPNTPIAECKVDNCLNAAHLRETPAVCDVDNGEFIFFHIFVKGAPEAMKSPKADMINPNPIPAEGIYHLVKVIRQKDGGEVPVRFYFPDSGSPGDGTLWARLAMEIPESDTVRHSKAEAFWKTVKARATKEELKMAMTDERSIAVFQEILRENQVGTFKIICTYVSTMPGTWKGELQAPPVTINVLNTGTIFEKMLKREAKNTN